MPPHKEEKESENKRERRRRTTNFALSRAIINEDFEGRDEIPDLMYWLNRDEESQGSREVEKSKDNEERQETEKSEEGEGKEREANLALSRAIIREDVNGRDKIPEIVSNRDRDERNADTHADKESRGGKLLRKGDDKPPVDDVSPKLTEAARSPRPPPQISRKRQRDSSLGSLDSPLGKPVVGLPQRDSAGGYSPYSDSATAPLDHYIRLVSNSMSLPTPSNPYFNSPEHAPVLHRNRENKIIAYSGSFNPPHLGHFELAYHTFLRSSSATIALLLLPLRDRLKAKDKAVVNGKTFATTKPQRIALLQNDLLQRWTWFFEGHRTRVAEYQAALMSEAKKDGFQLSFTALGGSDHYERCFEAGSLSPIDIGTGDMVTSDITRSSSLFVGLDCPPRQLPGCESWRLVSTPSSRKGDFSCECGQLNHECRTSRRIDQFTRQVRARDSVTRVGNVGQGDILKWWERL